METNCSTVSGLGKRITMLRGLDSRTGSSIGLSSYFPKFQGIEMAYSHLADALRNSAFQ